MAHLPRTAALLPLMLAFVACSSDTADVATATALAAPQREAQPLPARPALFVLGDSLSDVGNAAGAVDNVLNVLLNPPTVGLCNPADVLVLRRRCDDLLYNQSRVSDGPVAVEHLAAQLELPPLRPSLHVLPNHARDGTVYAVAGAKAAGSNDEDLGRQVDWLLLDHAPLSSEAIYVVMIGGNDALRALKADLVAGAAIPPSTAMLTAAVDAIGTSVERLLDFGARRVVVANVPDLAQLPAVRAAARATADERRVLALASAISARFNRDLAAKLDAIEAGRPTLQPPAAIVRFDFDAALSTAAKTLAANGANTLDGCFDTELYRSSPLARRRFHADCAPASDDSPPRFAGFLFFDEIHPTGIAHAAIGDALHAALQPALGL